MSAVHRERAFAKLTRTLRVVGRRSDGYHLLESEMVSLDLVDDLEFDATAPSHLDVLDAIAWTDSTERRATEVPSDETNLVRRALDLAGRSAAVRLTKRIPPGAGLGGGSSDAAAALRFAGIDDLVLATRLGADVPFCLRGGRAFVSGIGEMVEPLPTLDLAVVVVTPDFSVSTAAVYERYDALVDATSLVAGDGEGTNDLEAAAAAVEPRLIGLRRLVSEVAGSRAALAGSGSSYFVECAPGDLEALATAVEASLRAGGIGAVVSRCRTTPRLEAGGA